MAPTAKAPPYRGMTLIEVLVALAVLVIIGLLLFGTFDSLSRGKKGEAIKAQRAKEGRGAVLRIARELHAAFLSHHTPTNTALVTRATAFYGQNIGHFDRVDFTAFGHLRTDREAKESDQAEIGFFVVKDPERPEKMDLVRREQTPIDTDPQKGGVVNVLAEDIDSFELRYLDAGTGLWTETWDSASQAAQFGRVPLQVQITLVLAHVPAGVESRYVTKVFVPIQQPLTFALPR